MLLNCQIKYVFIKSSKLVIGFIPRESSDKIEIGILDLIEYHATWRAAASNDS